MRRHWMIILVVALMAGIMQGASPSTRTWATISSQTDLNAALAGILNAMARGDEAAVADSMLLGMKLTREQSLLYARRLILGSQLQWLLSEKFGAGAARTVMVRGQLEFIPQVDATKLKWNSVHASPQSVAAGSLEVTIGRAGDRSGGFVVLARTAGGWKLDRSGAIPAVLAMHVEDAPWRNGVIQRVIDDVKSGKLNRADAVGDALILHAPVTRPATGKGDRSTPAGAIAALFEAIENGDEATVEDSFRYMHESDHGAMRRQFAERVVADRKLAKALRAKFGPEQGARLESNCGLQVIWLDIYRDVGWVVDGDVARAAIEQNRYGYRYDVTKRMIRAGGVWRIEYPPTDLVGPRRPKTEAENQEDSWLEDRPRRENEMLAHLDRYPTPGSVIDALNAGLGEQPGLSEKEEARQADQQVKEARKELATKPAATTQEAFEQQMGVMILELGAALAHQDAKAAAKFYIADGDDGTYALARETRALGIQRLIEAADKEIDSGAQRVMGNLLDLADDLYGLAMIEWKVQGNAAVGKLPEGEGADSFWLPKLRKAGGAWKIDVTGEMDGNAKAAAARAMDETKKIEQLTGEVRGLKFKTLDQFKAAFEQAAIKGANRPMN